MSILTDIAAEQQRAVGTVTADYTSDQKSTSPFEQSFPYAPWIHPPDNFQAFDQVAAIATPDVATGDITVLQFEVPFGWDGVIRRLSHNYTGAGFVQGTGGIIWRLLVDGQAVRNYDSMLVEFGSVQSPRCTDGIRIYSRQIIKYVVNVTGINFQPSGVSQTICCLAGWIYPRGLA